MTDWDKLTPQIKSQSAALDSVASLLRRLVAAELGLIPPVVAVTEPMAQPPEFRRIARRGGPT